MRPINGKKWPTDRLLTVKETTPVFTIGVCGQSCLPMREPVRLLASRMLVSGARGAKKATLSES